MNDQQTKSEEPASKREGDTGSSCNELLSGARRARSVSTNIKCEDNRGRTCRVKGSVRAKYVSLSIHGGDEWAHMTTKQAMRLAQWIVKAVGEADAR
jgi:hypothetical protein